LKPPESALNRGPPGNRDEEPDAEFSLGIIPRGGPELSQLAHLLYNPHTPTKHVSLYKLTSQSAPLSRAAPRVLNLILRLYYRLVTVSVSVGTCAVYKLGFKKKKAEALTTHILPEHAKDITKF
jgi:hypothetical protein